MDELLTKHTQLITFMLIRFQCSVYLNEAFIVKVCPTDAIDSLVPVAIQAALVAEFPLKISLH